MLKLDVKRLIEWFAAQKRDFPWRKGRDPYYVLVSEIMLQQTLSAVVVPYFLRWIKAFPTIEALAAAEETEVLKHWEGLGYYSRARNLHAAAKECVKSHNSQVPSDAESLKMLKGVGPYTQGAVLSFAFRKKVPAVDANVARVLARYFYIDDLISSSTAQKKIWQHAKESLPESNSHIFNEALIELGALICGKNPACMKCPLQEGCKAYQKGDSSRLPLKKRRERTIHLRRMVPILSYQDKFLVTYGEKGKVMEGLVQFPYFAWESSELCAVEVGEFLQKTWGIKALYQGHLSSVKHTFTKYRVELLPVHFHISNFKEVEGFLWQTKDVLSKKAFSSGHRQIFNYLFQQTS